MVQYTLPAGATAARTAEVNRQIVDWFLINEKANTDVILPLMVSVLAAADRTPGWRLFR